MRASADVTIAVRAATTTSVIWGTYQSNTQADSSRSILNAGREQTSNTAPFTWQVPSSNQQTMRIISTKPVNFSIKYLQKVFIT